MGTLANVLRIAYIFVFLGSSSLLRAKFVNESVLQVKTIYPQQYQNLDTFFNERTSVEIQYMQRYVN